MTQPTTPAGPKARALAYAENVLGVHQVFTQANEARLAMDEAMTEVAKQKDLRRTLDDAIATRELEIYSDERGKHADLSQAALERHLKVETHRDPQLVELRSKLSACISSIEGFEYDIRAFETDVRIAVARMNELGGYFNYLAAIKAS